MANKIIGGKRCCGKTTELIKKASAEHLYILCANKSIAKMIFNQAKDMGLDIPYPITIHDLPLDGSQIEKVLIDEVETVLQQLIGRRVAVMSTSCQLEELPSLRREGNLKEIEGITINIDARKVNPPLLTIELENESSVPKVFYKGEEVKHKSNILFDWDTNDGRSPGGMTYAIDHYEEGKGQLVRNRIERSFRDHA